MSGQSAKGNQLRLACLVLGAGGSRRFGGENKLLKKHGQKSLCQILIETVNMFQWEQKCFVAGYQYDRMLKQLGPWLKAEWHVLNNLNWLENGMSGSLLTGLQFLLKYSLDGVAVFLADTPLAKPGSIQALVDMWAKTPGKWVRPTFLDRPGHPVIIPSEFLRDMQPLDDAGSDGIHGDVGGKKYLEDHPDELVLLPVDDPGVCTDFDTQDDFKRGRS